MTSSTTAQRRPEDQRHVQPRSAQIAAAISFSIGAVRVMMTKGRPIRMKYGSHMPTW